MAAAYALLLTGLAVATSWPGAPDTPDTPGAPGASGVLLGALAMAAGACVPPLGPVMRTLWSRLVPDRDLLRRAYSLDTVAEELLFVTGPLLVALLVRVAAPPAGLAVSAALVLTGAFALITSPAVRSWTGRGKALPVAAPPKAPDASGVPSRRWPPRVAPGLRQAIAVSAAMGGCLGAFDLLVIAFADAHGAPAVVAWVLAALSGGSAIGGLLHGAVAWRVPHRTRLAFLAVALGIPLASAGFVPHPAVLVAWAALGGLFVAPALTTAYLIADECAAPAARTRSGAWVNTSFNAGSAGSTAAAGLLVGRFPLTVCFALAAAPVLLSAATALRFPRRRAAPEAVGLATRASRPSR
ncbi:hypothetical protein GCM10010305_58290 [Streptomyces termitum]|uniref:MFS transporter n=1 Tax=Streptomyces termitum TaxID=67368 RepID=A0A918WCS5_9ACTN|nr:hypothetical protein GCM10010305_58290 [Streptomyces termitum]